MAVSRRWSRQQRFDRDALRAWLEETELERVKGIFRTSLGWFRAERAGGEVWMSRSTPRDCSMVDLIQQGELAEAEAHLEAVDDLRERPPRPPRMSSM